MTEKIETLKFYQIGNNLSVDFVNTLIAVDGKPKDLLTNLADFAAWAAAMDLLEKEQANWQEKIESEQIFAQILEFREMLHQMFESVEKGQAVKPTAISAINGVLRNQIGFPEIESSEKGFVKRFHTDFSEPRQLLATIAESAADLLCYGDLKYLKKCEDNDCVLYFYDTTKNHSRRWCSMTGCGNRAKAAAFYRRKRK